MGTWYAIEWSFLQRPNTGGGGKVICWYTGFTPKTFV